MSRLPFTQEERSEQQAAKNILLDNFLIKLQQKGLFPTPDQLRNIFTSVTTLSLLEAIIRNFNEGTSNDRIIKMKEICDEISPENFFYFMTGAGANVLEYIDALHESRQDIKQAIRNLPKDNIHKIFKQASQQPSIEGRNRVAALLREISSTTEDHKSLKRRKSIEGNVSFASQAVASAGMSSLPSSLFAAPNLFAQRMPQQSLSPATFLPSVAYRAQLLARFPGSSFKSTESLIYKFSAQIAELEAIFPNPNDLFSVINDRDGSDESCAVAVWGMCANVDRIKNLIGVNGFNPHLHFHPQHLLDILKNAGKNCDFVLKQLEKTEVRQPLLQQCEIDFSRILELINHPQIGHRHFFDSFKLDLNGVVNDKQLDQIFNPVNDPNHALYIYHIVESLKQDGKFATIEGIRPEQLAMLQPAQILDKDNMDRLSILLQLSPEPRKVFDNLQSEIMISANFSQAIKERFDHTIRKCVEEIREQKSCVDLDKIYFKAQRDIESPRAKSTVVVLKTKETSSSKKKENWKRDVQSAFASAAATGSSSEVYYQQYAPTSFTPQPSLHPAFGVHLGPFHESPPDFPPSSIPQPSYSAQPPSATTEPVTSQAVAYRQNQGIFYPTQD